MHASIIIPTYQRAPFLSDLLGMLADQVSESRRQLELIVVDSDPALSALSVYIDHERSYPCPIRYIPTLEPGLSRARTAGARAARWPILLYLDDDVIPCDRFVDLVLDTFDHRVCDVVVCRVTVSIR